MICVLLFLSSKCAVFASNDPLFTLKLLSYTREYSACRLCAYVRYRGDISGAGGRQQRWGDTNRQRSCDHRFRAKLKPPHSSWVCVNHHLPRSASEIFTIHDDEEENFESNPLRSWIKTLSHVADVCDRIINRKGKQGGAGNHRYLRCSNKTLPEQSGGSKWWLRHTEAV